jgi:hypothetical protein
MQKTVLNLCTDPNDPDLLDRLRWEVTLDNGLVIYQKTTQCWKQLKKYCFNNELFIKDLILRLRSHIIHPCPTEMLSYAYWEGMGFTEGLQIPYIYIGWISFGESVMNCSKWQSPTLELIGFEQRADLIKYNEVII